MNQPKAASPIEEAGILLIVPERPADAMLARAAAIAATYNAQLQVFCPIVVAPVPHSGATPGIESSTADHGIAREEGRKLATSTLGFLNARDVDAQIETGTCRSVTEGVLDTVRRLQPDLVLLPRSSPSGLFEQPFTIRFDEIWSKLDVPTWLLGPGQDRGSNVVGLLDFDRYARDKGTENDRVATEAVRLASTRHADVHLVACTRQPLALTTTSAAVAPEDLTNIPRRRKGQALRKLRAIAAEYRIAETHVHPYHGSAADVLQQMLEPLDVGLVVVSGRPHRRLGGLWKHHLAAELTGLDCDLLVLGESDVPHA
jgi:nucleotide-binding universal stress UspA family protein